MTFKPARLPIKNLADFGLGLNDQLQASEIRDSELSDCENVSVDEGVLKSAPGFARWDNGNNPGPYWGVYAFKKSDGTLNTIRQRKDVLEYAIDGGEDWVACTLPATGSPAATVSLTQKHPTFCTLNDICVFANGQVVMYSSDGITWTNKTDLIYGGDIPDIVFNSGRNRLLYTVNSKSLIWWSEINSPLVVGVDSWQYIDPNAGQALVGLALTPQGSLLCFKEGGVYELDDITSGMVGVNFIGSAKCSSHHTICTTKHSVIFGSWGDLVSEYVSGVIRNISGNITIIGRNNSVKENLFCAAYYNDKYRISIPNADVSADYNAQEYVFDLSKLRDDPYQPYVITRNTRYYGCYGIEDAIFDYGRDITLYVGDSRPETTSGSPATYDNDLFAFVNDYREPYFTQGLDGEAQYCYAVTKFFTENLPFYVKRYKKLFANLKVDQDLTVTFSYRFAPYGSWTDYQVMFSASELDMTYDDGSVGVFSEGYGFSDEILGDSFIDIENSDKPKGIQFKISWSSINDVTIYGLAYNFRPKQKFK
jgi:hypothetical protein